MPTHGEKWAPAESVKKAFPSWHWIRIWPDGRRPGLSWDPEEIAHGENAGYQMLNIAALAGANPILLIGYDMQPTYGKLRWKGRQADGVEKGRADKFAGWRERFATTVAQLEARGIEVINCTRETALQCFRRALLEDVLSSF